MEHQLHLLLLDEIKRRAPKSQGIVHVLMESLSLGKEAAYRRLRSDVPFTLQEAAVIAKKYSISLDELIGVDLEKSRVLRLKLPGFVELNDSDCHMYTDFLDFFESISLRDETETGLVTNALPQEIFSNFELITKLNIFKWQYYYSYEKRIPFKDLVVPEIVQECFRKQFVYAKNFKKTHYVFDRRIFIRLIKEIEYFSSIDLIDGQSLEAIRQELLLLIDYLERLAITGEFAETGNGVYMYVTDMEVPFSCAYIKADDVEYALMKTFILTSVTSFDPLIYEKVKDWISSSVRTSTLITKSSDIERIAFFGKQREFVRALQSK